MPFNWGEYLNVSRHLENQSRQPNQSLDFVEACQRAAVSRAYYAAFCTARNYAQAQMGYTPTKTGDDHKNVRELFRQHPYLYMRKVFTNLKRLSRLRKECDYDDTVDNLSKKLQEAVKLAEDILKLLST